MKKFRFLVLCLSLVALLVLGLVACTGDEGAASGTSTEPAKSDTASATEKTPDADTETDTDADTETDTASDTASETEKSTESTPDFSGKDYVRISSAEDLMAFNRAVNGDEDVDFDDKTVVLLNDIDLAGLEWTSLDGARIPYITFDGQGHTIRNMTINYGLNRDIDPEGLFVGAGFIGTVPASAEVTFKNITFEDTKIVARERHVGCLVGRSLGGACTFENVTVRNFRLYNKSWGSPTDRRRK